MGMVWRILAVICLLFCGGFASYQGGKMISNGYKSRDWPAVQGQVVESRVDSRTVTKTSDGKRRTMTEYRAVIRYEYSVGGMNYTGDRLTVERTGYSGKNRGAAENAIKAYPTGSVVFVYYDPNNPAEAVLKPRAAGPAAWVLVAAGPGLLVAAILVAFRRHRRPMLGNVAMRAPSSPAAAEPTL